MRRLVARRYQVVRHRTRIKNEVHAILHTHLIPKCPHADLFNKRGREWLMRQPVPDDEHATLCWHMLTKGEDYRWARPSLVAHENRSMELAAGLPQEKGNQCGATYAYHVKELRHQEMRKCHKLCVSGPAHAVSDT
ncbi:hypothetical protein EDD52_11810 [Primorskyibacter sedentarius]|uniref:Uncharacterized protein n=1 Tax=Primorskyibacter sedentarius TaxID=745311 RepID=A0A4R3J1X9_9RHOB|nr:hypothetical protein [Primorskyibacter sedentarius]TCS59799.1 hypothetical protein EDD52_11810 [Primorskyibacter sedentarius]